ncbi:uncharacterized protein LOC113865779 isoform X2 [Abrus precatorius]|uniref:Uncharacterized protein LOC113865779 isoform X2 n=1 Tax=Abrus precatorius TaxID=3816 RepID=A0A8B8LJA6_ABRPR|nr:uncharacterized protein LOC113865779 isoform X2 [Abrus precatorius]
MEEKLSGFIFMCNRITKPECYRCRVFGLPSGRKEVVEKINPGTYLFLFDTDVKLLYGIYVATSTGKLKIEPLAFGQKFPAQVKFKNKDCLPLPENCFKHAIQDNYLKGSNKFNPELNIRQVRSLIELFRPLHVLPTTPTHPVWEKPVNYVFDQISRPPLSDGIFLSRISPNQAPRLLNYEHVNKLEASTGPAYPVNDVMPNSAAAQSVPSQASSYQLYAPQYSHQAINPQPEFHSSLVNSCQAQSLQDSQHAHHTILNSPPEFQSSSMTMGSSHAQSVQVPQYPYQSIPNPSTVGDNHAQLVQVPQYPYQSILNSLPDFHSQVANASNSHTHWSWYPHYTHQNIPSSQLDTFSTTTVNTRSVYAQVLPDHQHTHQNAQNPQPDFNSSTVNVGHANVMMQSHASSSSYYPYIPQEAVSATYSSQGEFRRRH